MISVSEPTASTIGGRHRDRGRRAVELTAAVIGHDQSRGAGLHADARILDVEDAFENELAGPKGF